MNTQNFNTEDAGIFVFSAPLEVAERNLIAFDLPVSELIIVSIGVVWLCELIEAKRLCLNCFYLDDLINLICFCSGLSFSSVLIFYKSCQVSECPKF